MVFIYQRQICTISTQYLSFRSGSPSFAYKIPPSGTTSTKDVLGRRRHCTMPYRKSKIAALCVTDFSRSVRRSKFKSYEKSRCTAGCQLSGSQGELRQHRSCNVHGDRTVHAPRRILEVVEEVCLLQALHIYSAVRLHRRCCLPTLTYEHIHL